MKEIIRWGVLGCAGFAAKAVIPAIQSSRLGRVHAIASRDPGRAAKTAARFGIPKAHGSDEAMLADPDIDAFYSPLPNHLQVPMGSALIPSSIIPIDQRIESQWL